MSYDMSSNELLVLFGFISIVQVKTGGELDSTSSLENLLGGTISISPVD